MQLALSWVTFASLRSTPGLNLSESQAKVSDGTANFSNLGWSDASLSERSETLGYANKQVHFYCIEAKERPSNIITLNVCASLATNVALLRLTARETLGFLQVG